jgi:hypothetical protein
MRRQLHTIVDDGSHKKNEGGEAERNSFSVFVRSVENYGSALRGALVRIQSATRYFKNFESKSPLCFIPSTMNPRTALLPRLGLTLLLSLLFLVACDWHGLRGNGELKTETRSLSAFVYLEAHGAYDLHWESGSPSVVISTDENLLSHIRTRTKGDKLEIDTDTHIWPRQRLKVKVSSQSLRGAELSGAVRFDAEKLSGPGIFSRNHRRVPGDFGRHRGRAHCEHDRREQAELRKFAYPQGGIVRYWGRSRRSMGERSLAARLGLSRGGLIRPACAADVR